MKLPPAASIAGLRVPRTPPGSHADDRPLHPAQEIGAVWTDEARFGAMRDVEVAAAEALDGPTPEDLAAIRAATFTVAAIDEREKLLDHDTAAASTCSRPPPARRALDPLRDDVLRRARHRARAAAQARGG